ncbi:transposase [uncultured Umboniibacter sp.]|uniref:RNA-guided endonuclease InsQ/TnpB family protein n=1 Tax=uncultured Umboniibacter sp. TaxID=1798917 RepID=UPI0026040C9E|nr:transposase [uncultured Umboniibacter sp.]
MTHTKSLKVRVRDKHAKLLDQMAREANFVWNFYNELSYTHLQRTGEWLSGYDLQKYSKGASKLMLLDSTAIQAIAEEFAIRRKQFKKAKLRWRVSRGAKRSLGWIPFKKGAAQWVNGQVRYAGQYFKVWDSYGLSEYDFRAGSFTQDARGRWYFNVVVQIETEQSEGVGSVGIDLGLKTLAQCSDGTELEAVQWYRKSEQQLAVAQRANKEQRVKAIHAKTANRRKDALHKFSRRLVDENAAIFVGDVSSQKLVKTRMAKSVLDAGWSTLKTMLEYKCDHAGIVFEEVNECYTTQTCSSCGDKPPERPKGIAGLGIREWQCSGCGVTHDRDINAALNILALGHERLAGGIPVL